MGTIATNFETVGVSDTASISIDVDAMVRKAMIKLFGLKDANGNDIDEYDDAYYDAGLPSEKENVEPPEPGMPSLTRGFIIFETETLSFLFQQVLYMIKPIKIALEELPDVIPNPLQVIEKIKEIIENIKSMIEEVTTFITDTKQWFIDTLLGGLADINIPIPEITLTILGIDITLPKIDKGDLLNEPAFEEKGGSKIAKLKDEILELQKKLSSLKDNLKDIMDNMITTLLEVQIQLISILYEGVYSYYELILELYSKILAKRTLATNYMDTNDIAYANHWAYLAIDKTSELETINEELSNITDKQGLRIFNGNPLRLLEITSELTTIMTNSASSLTTLITEKGINIASTAVDTEIDNIKSNMEAKLEELAQPIADLQENIQAIIDMKDAALEDAQENIERLEQEIRDKIKEKMDEIIALSPATAWILSMVNLFINMVKAPINFIIDLITKILEAVIQFLQELPIPTFEKFKEFFGDLLGLANVSKMSDFVTGVLESLAPFADPELIAKVAEFLPNLIVTVGTEFITSILPDPLPI